MAAAIALGLMLPGCGESVVEPVEYGAGGEELSARVRDGEADRKVLILARTVNGGLSSQEAVAALSLGLSVEVVTDAQWGAKTAADFATYRAIILGDPSCGAVTSVDAAVANRNTWSQVINGNVLIAGTAPVFRQRPVQDSLTRSAIAFATAQPGKTGAYISLSCYYANAAASTPVPLLEPFGRFTVARPIDCYNNAHVVAQSTLLPVTDASLSNWNCSAFEVFDTYPASNFSVLAIARDPSDTDRYPGSVDFADGSHGVPYLLARGATPVRCGNGVVEDPEQCDEGAGNGAMGHACSASCRLHWCGDGVVDADEQCDPGAGSGAVECTAFCRSTAANHPPVARCRSITLSAGAACGASGSVDDGSYDTDNNLQGCTQSPAGPWNLGTHTVMLTCRDVEGMTSSCTSTVTVVDDTPPAVTCPRPQVVECTAGGATVSPGIADATDNCGSATVTSHGQERYPLGTTQVTYTGTDTAGNSASCTTAITVQDTLGPAIQLAGNSSVYLECARDSYQELGATARDQCYPDDPATVTISGSVNPRQLGSQLIRYTSSDRNGLISTVYREVLVSDTLPPVINAGSVIPPPVECGEALDVERLRATFRASATDLCSGNDVRVASVDVSGVNTGAVGRYPVTFRVVDAAENYASGGGTVDVRDTRSPALTLQGPPSVRLECGLETYQELGARAVDTCSGDVSGRVTADSSSVNTSVVGNYQVSYVATDPSGNVAATLRQVQVVDTSRPSISLAGPREMEIALDSDFDDPGATATDACSGDLSGAIVTHGEVNTHRPGRYQIAYDVTDAAGLAAQTQIRLVLVKDPHRSYYLGGGIGCSTTGGRGGLWLPALVGLALLAARRQRRG